MESYSDTLDLILTNRSSSNSISSAAAIGSSDHILITVLSNNVVDIVSNQSRININKYILSRALWDGLRDIYLQFPWKSLFNDSSSDTLDHITEIINLEMETYIPSVFI